MKVVDLLVAWRDSGKVLDRDTTLEIIGAFSTPIYCIE